MRCCCKRSLAYLGPHSIDEMNDVSVIQIPVITLNGSDVPAAIIVRLLVSSIHLITRHVAQDGSELRLIVKGSTFRYSP